MTEEEPTIDQIFEMYSKIIREGFVPDDMCVSIDSLQSIHPRLTDKVLEEEYGIIRGVHFVVLRNDGIFPGYVQEDESEQV